MLEQRAAEYAAAEAHRRALLAQAEVALWEKVQMAAAEAAAEARVAFRYVAAFVGVWMGLGRCGPGEPSWHKGKWRRGGAC